MVPLAERLYNKARMANTRVLWINRKGVLYPLALMVLLVFCPAFAVHAQQTTHISATTIPQDRLVQPAQLNHELATDPHAALILQVGSRVLFDEAHIAGAEYAGPASRSEGLQTLRARVADLPRDLAIVLYCGCCPWDHCPNLGPAWQLLRSMGFTHVRALYISQNFGADWVAQGYRVEKSN